MKEFSDIMLDIVGGQNPLCTRQEVALQMGVTVETIANYLSGTQPRWDATVRLSHYLIREHEYWALAVQAMLVCNNGNSNGIIDDELWDMIELVPVFRSTFGKGGTGFQNAIGKLESIVDRLKAEDNNR